jgi:hypothetical protein
MKQKIKWDSQIDKFSKEDLYALGNEIFYYCRNVLKLKPRGGVYPILWIRPKKKSQAYGEYCPFLHSVEIFASECDTLRRFVDTVIHEYVHSCQAWIGVRYVIQSEKVGYKKNSFEVEARRIAKEERTGCITHLKEIFNV